MFLATFAAKSLFKETVTHLGDSRSTQSSILHFVYLVLGIIVTLFVIHENFLWAAVAWDTVWYWSIEANEFLFARIQKDGAFSTIGPHPKTLIYITAWGGWSASFEILFVCSLYSMATIIFSDWNSIFGLFLRKLNL